MKEILKRKLFAAFLIGLYSVAFSQVSNDPVLMTIGGDKITKSEFLNVYKKNNAKNDAIDKKALDDYLQLYENFKLKVKEASDLGLDTVSAFKSELGGYRKQLAQPYLTDKDVTDQLIKEAYDRMNWDIRASHILLRLNSNALPNDTLAVYNKILELRNRILKGEKFEKIAKEFSDDPSARDTEANGKRPAVKGNGGDLGYFTAFDMVYPFETGTYNTKVGEISMPVRTSFGYHLIYITDKKKAMGRVQVAHILISIPTDSTGLDTSKFRNKAFEIYDKIQKGESYEELAKQFSDDKGSASKGGVLPWFGVNRMVPEFIIAIGTMKNKGEVHAPIKTPYGWHIIKLIDKKEIGTYEELKNDIKNKVAKDSRALRSKDAILAKIKKEYNFTENIQALNEFIPTINDSIYQGKWNPTSAEKLNKELFKIGDKSINQADFTKYIASHQSPRNKEDVSVLLNSLYKAFVEDNCLAYEDSKLESKYLDFKLLMNEYHDGILLFELTDRKVWSKAVKDTVGLQEFYNKNKNNYMWGERVDASIYTCLDKKIADKTRKLIKKGLSNDDILKEINKESQLNLKIESNKYSKSDNPTIDSIAWKEGISDNINKNNSVIIVNIKKKLQPEPKQISEARGIITADYQNYLEKEWISYLRNKYKIEINDDVYQSLLK